MVRNLNDGSKGHWEVFLKKILLEAQAEKKHLKIFLEASFFQNQAYHSYLKCTVVKKECPRDFTPYISKQTLRGLQKSKN